MQSEYSLWIRNAEIKVLDTCKQSGVTFVAFSPLARAVLTGKLQDMQTLEASDLRHKLPRFQCENFNANLQLLVQFAAIAAENNCTQAQLALT